MLRLILQLPGGQKTNGEQPSQMTELLLGLRDNSTVKSMLDSVPPKKEADRLISKYFNTLDLAECMCPPVGFALT